MGLWKPAARMTEAELARRTAPGARSAGARVARLPGGGRLTYWEFGDPAGAPIIALHGMGVSGLTFADHEPFFRERGLRCIAPNVVGGLAEPSLPRGWWTSPPRPWPWPITSDSSGSP